MVLPSHVLECLWPQTVCQWLRSRWCASWHFGSFDRARRLSRTRGLPVTSRGRFPAAGAGRRPEQIRHVRHGCLLIRERS
ncbi:hypothetical protein NBRC3257_1984 [Gluconobacter thailandicus NBRC 3257]|uniref:Transposase n=1 Tax=Gluconobacter thailandicus NBRC 3257 TaxID=1381097 RepID=A0ABQ0IXQ0_GLUTH|nr:hypothetical protein NBRC3255_1075 [Gluconobacter thailandicus NBRC 3255]GAD26984.1 hypothetical protein NBRC3257_1984 [Gluconobacter thailandicus NBRC 3257]